MKCGMSIEVVRVLVVMRMIIKGLCVRKHEAKELKKRLKYFQKLADELPDDLENKELLYKKYMEHIDKIKMEGLSSGLLRRV